MSDIEAAKALGQAYSRALEDWTVVLLAEIERYGTSNPEANDEVCRAAGHRLALQNHRDLYDRLIQLQAKVYGFRVAAEYAIASSESRLESLRKELKKEADEPENS